MHVLQCAVLTHVYLCIICPIESSGIVHKSSTNLLQVVSTSCRQSANDKMQQATILTGLRLDEIDGFVVASTLLRF